MEELTTTGKHIKPFNELIFIEFIFFFNKKLYICCTQTNKSTRAN